MGSFFRLFLIAGAILVFAAAGSSQDLGSSNKLFGGKPQLSPKTANPKPKTAAKPRSATKRTAAASKPAATSKPSEKNTGKKPLVKASATTAQKPRQASKGKPERSPAAEAKTVAKKSVDKPSQKIPAETIAAKPGVKPGSKSVTVDDRFKSFNPPASPLTEANKRLFEDLIREGNRARDDRNYSAAETAYQKARALNPKAARATYALGAVYSDQQRWTDAEAAYRDALKLDPADPVTHIALSYVLTQPLAVDNLSDRYAEAENLARKAIQLAPSNALASDQLGVALELRGYTGAETEGAYQRAIQVDPQFAPAHAHLGRLLRRRGQTQAADAAYKTAIDRSTDPSSLVVIAEVMQSEQRFAESEPLLRRALDKDPRNSAALLLLGRALTTEGDFAGAEIMLRRATDVSPSAFMPNSLLGSLYLRQAKYPQAENALLQAERWALDGDRRRLARQFETLGDAYSTAGNRANAERSYRRAARLDNQNTSLADKLAKMVGR